MDFSTVKLLYFLLRLIQNLWEATLRLCEYLLPILPKLVAARIVVKWWFSNSVIPSVFISRSSIVQKSFLSLLFSLPLFSLLSSLLSFFPSVWTHEFLCYLMDHELLPSLLILMLKLPHIWPVGPLALWTIPIICKALLCFLAQQDVPGSFCTFSAPNLESAISLRNFGSFSWELVLRNKDLGIIKCKKLNHERTIDEELYNLWVRKNF